jgi:hypothetical protein
MSAHILLGRQFMYHHSPVQNRESIRQHGLLASDPHAPGNSAHELPGEDAPRGVYLAGGSLSEHEYHTAPNPSGTGHDIWRVHTEGLDLHQDPGDYDNYYGFKMSHRDIDPSRVTLAMRGKSK